MNLFQSQLRIIRTREAYVRAIRSVTEQFVSEIGCKRITRDTWSNSEYRIEFIPDPEMNLVYSAEIKVISLNPECKHAGCYITFTCDGFNFTEADASTDVRMYLNAAFKKIKEYE